MANSAHRLSAQNACVKLGIIGVVGVIIPRTSQFAFQNPFYPSILLGISATASQHDYQLMLSINKQENALSYDPRYIVESDFSKRDGFRLMDEPAESNARLVAGAVRIARELGKEPATPDEARGAGLTGTAG